MNLGAATKESVPPPGKESSIITLVRTDVCLEQAAKAGVGEALKKFALRSVGQRNGFWTKYRHDEVLLVGKVLG
jgi:hypothetical protein